MKISMLGAGRFRLSFCALSAAVLVSSTTATKAAAPWQALVPFKKVDVDPNSSYPVAQTNGPWMIMATTFHGEDAETKAQALVYELRSKYKLPAYTYSKTFDFTKPERGRGLDRYGKPKQMRYQEAKVVKEVAVLVGDYDTIDDPAAEKTLKKIKSLTPACLKDEAADSQSKSKGWFVSGATVNRNKKGPMGHAIVATNPLLPPEYFNSKGVDRLVLEMNKEVEHSLLDCPGKYTVKVGTFTGAAVIDERKIDEVNRGKSMASKLEEAADMAHRMTKRLRQMGVEAYEFHDRTQSIVCVGNFAVAGMPREDGGFDVNPAILEVMRTYGPEKTVTAAGVAMHPKSIGPSGITVHAKDGDGSKVQNAKAEIFFDIEPEVMEVPRRSIASDYQRSMLNQR